MPVATSPRVQIDRRGPRDLVDEGEGVDQLAGRRVVHVEEAVAVGLAAVLAAVLALERDEFVHAVVVPAVVRRVLVVPADRAGGHVGLPAFWPEFAAAGKDQVTCRAIASHQAGLCGLRRRRPRPTCCPEVQPRQRLAQQEPIWEPTSASGYHALSIGILGTELFRRVACVLAGICGSGQGPGDVSGNCVTPSRIVRVTAQRIDKSRCRECLICDQSYKQVVGSFGHVIRDHVLKLNCYF
ncbi:serine hydrolase domain-containing protein [Mycobacterium tuberculosis]|uniref:serine hydrolase domain-containing protein n=1 Tax=Mycobacterium tuberculosis TaxID=1773 RepID=UPI00350F2F52